MFTYLFSFIVIFLFAIKDSLVSVTSILPKYKYTFIFFGVLALIVGIRDMIGGYDVYVYGEFFDNFVQDQITAYFLLFEPGYVIYNGIVKTFTQNRYIFFFVTSLITYFLFYKNITKYASCVYFSLFILYCKLFLMSFVYVRQCMAMGIVWLSIPYAIEKERMKFIFFILLGVSFHVSAVIFSLIYLVARKRLSNITILSIALLSLFLGLTSFVKIFLSFASDVFYIPKTLSSADVNGVNYFYLLESSLLLIGLLLKKNRLYNDSKISLAMTNVSLLYVYISFITLREPTALRCIWYFLIACICIIPKLCIYTHRVSAHILLCLIIYLTTSFFRMLFVWDGGDFIPYKSFFSDQERESLFQNLEYDTNYRIDKFYK